MNKIQVINNINKLNRAYINITIDLEHIEKIDDFIKEVYKWLWCPNDFWLNLNAFFDTIKDTQFWVKKPLNIIVKNSKSINMKNIDLKMLLSDIFIDIIQIWGQNYSIYLLTDESFDNHR